MIKKIKSVQDMFEEKQERIQNRIGNKDRQIQVSASFNRASNIIGNILAGTNLKNIDVRDLANRIDGLARLIFYRESKFNDELANYEARKLEKADSHFQAEDFEPNNYE